ncbi:Dephospho-CoA kinase [hydrothermal vent metagenome]|uniref:Dephospho-CoA kinase n=1 Tax=hydrothermal vent metagenome TaxID=652676 RepID=A0A3B1C283_9ZZZZ
MPLIGVTGGLATGKSLVSSMLVDLGARLIDCDVLAREVTAPGSDGLTKVKAEFGETVIRDDGALNREELASLVFSDPAKLSALEGILHPIIKQLVMLRSKEIISKDKDAVVVVDAPLLFESGLSHNMDRNIVVVCELKEQKLRAKRRGGLSEGQIESRIAAQAPLSKKSEMADYIIDNSGKENETLAQVGEVWRKIRVSG